MTFAEFPFVDLYTFVVPSENIMIYQPSFIYFFETHELKNIKNIKLPQCLPTS